MLQQATHPTKCILSTACRRRHNSIHSSQKITEIGSEAGRWLLRNVQSGTKLLVSLEKKVTSVCCKLFEANRTAVHGTRTGRKSRDYHADKMISVSQLDGINKLLEKVTREIARTMSSARTNFLAHQLLLHHQTTRDATLGHVSLCIVITKDSEMNVGQMMTAEQLLGSLSLCHAKPDIQHNGQTTLNILILLTRKELFKSVMD